jgi:hypothetical protein
VDVLTVRIWLYEQYTIFKVIGPVEEANIYQCFDGGEHSHKNTVRYAQSHLFAEKV